MLSHPAPGPGESGPGEEAARVFSAFRAGPAWPGGAPLPRSAPPPSPRPSPRGGRLGFPLGPEGRRGRHVRAARGPVGPRAGEGPRAPRAGAGVGPGSATPDGLEGGPRRGEPEAPAADGAGLAHAVAPGAPRESR